MFMCVVCLVQCSSDKKHASGALLFVHRVAGVSLASWSMQALPAGSSMPISQCLRGPCASVARASVQIQGVEGG